jgi:hypothetical protein
LKSSLQTTLLVFHSTKAMESDMDLVTSSTSWRKETQATAAVQPGVPLEGVLRTDVLCGRDKLSYAHVGNKRFRHIIAMNREAYQTAAPSRAEKTSITSETIAMIRASGGRFLKLDEITGEFQELGEYYIHEKVSHALRSAQDPNRRRLKKRREVQKYIPTSEEDALFQETWREQQRIFQSLVSQARSSRPIIRRV